MSNYTNLEKELLSLARVLDDPRARDRRVLFDEFQREHEFGLALHTICDYLMENTLACNTQILVQVSRLHEMMKIEDDCLHRLELVCSSNK